MSTCLASLASRCSGFCRRRRTISRTARALKPAGLGIDAAGVLGEVGALLLQGRDAVNQVLQLVAVGGVQGGVVADRWRRLGIGFLTGHMSFSSGNGLGLAAGRQILPVDEAPNTAPT